MSLRGFSFILGTFSRQNVLLKGARTVSIKADALAEDLETFRRRRKTDWKRRQRVIYPSVYASVYSDLKRCL